jgi:hypothetical protein
MLAYAKLKMPVKINFTVLSAIASPLCGLAGQPIAFSL